MHRCTAFANADSIDSCCPVLRFLTVDLFGMSVLFLHVVDSLLPSLCFHQTQIYFFQLVLKSRPDVWGFGLRTNNFSGIKSELSIVSIVKLKSLLSTLASIFNIYNILYSCK